MLNTLVVSYLKGGESKLINYLSLFSGIGAFEKALKNLNIDFNLIGYCEIDEYANKAYSLIHNEPKEKNLGDITRLMKQ